MNLPSPCDYCKTRRITWDGIRWTCSHCGMPTIDLVDAEKQRVLGLVRTKLGQNMSEETVETLLEGIE